MNQTMDTGFELNNVKGNIILNHDFSRDLLSWHANNCAAFVTPEESYHVAVVTNRAETWQGLEQDITDRVSPGYTYSVSAFVRVRGCIDGSSHVQATLRLKKGAATDYLFVAR